MHYLYAPREQKMPMWSWLPSIFVNGYDVPPCMGILVCPWEGSETNPE
jgi:hypothetical protein